MKSNYKKLGEFIRPISVRNIDESVGLLLGLSVQKKFISSIANTIGTDMRTYKIIVKNQFAYIADTSRRGDKIGIALLENYDRAIISQAYDIFEVIDTQQLSPEYLMMWFRRPEFDRYARFKSHGSVRELFSWEDLCETELPVPSIEKQLEIVAEYNTLQNRISLNKQLINTLEATAQAIYKQWFVDFEFPDQNGLPYKSNGGEMIDSPLGEIPKGWEVQTIGDMAEIKAGGDRPKTFSENKTDKCPIPIYSNGVTNNGLYGYTDKHNYPKNTITISARGTIGFSVLRNEDFDAIVRLLVLIPKFSNSVIYLWQNIKKIEFDNSGSVQNQLTIPQVSVLSIIMPEREVLKKYQPLLMLVYQKINIYLTENQKLVEFQSLLLSRLSTLI